MDVKSDPVSLEITTSVHFLRSNTRVYNIIITIRQKREKNLGYFTVILS